MCGQSPCQVFKASKKNKIRLRVREFEIKRGSEIKINPVSRTIPAPGILH